MTSISYMKEKLGDHQFFILYLMQGLVSSFSNTD